MADTRPRITEAEFERMADAATMRRLTTDRAYLNAEDHDSQKAREDEIEREEIDRLDSRYMVADTPGRAADPDTGEGNWHNRDRN